MHVNGHRPNIQTPPRQGGGPLPDKKSQAIDNAANVADMGSAAAMYGGAGIGGGSALGGGAALGGGLAAGGAAYAGGMSDAGIDAMINAGVEGNNSALNSFFSFLTGKKADKQYLTEVPFSEAEINKERAQANAPLPNMAQPKGNVPLARGTDGTAMAPGMDGTAGTAMASGAALAPPVKAPAPPKALTAKSTTDPAVLAAIDNSEFSSPEQLKKWDAIVGDDLSPSERIAKEKVLNRPYAAAQLALKQGGGADCPAMEFFKSNPAVFRAVETRAGTGDTHNLMADNRYNNEDLKVFADMMNHRLDEANGMVSDYHKKHPDADEQSTSLVKSAALMYANDPILETSAKNKAVGSKDQQPTGWATMDDFKAMSDPNNNPDLSLDLSDGAKLWSKPGMFHILDDDNLQGKDLARKGGDKRIADKDFSSFIDHVAPSSGGGFADFLSYASMLNAAERVNISNLNHDIFDHPDKYSGAQKAAVMIKLESSLEYVKAGKDIRKTKQTEDDLREKIDKLHHDKSVQEYFTKEMSRNKRDILSASSKLSNNVMHHLQQDVITGKSLKDALKHDSNNAGQAVEDMRSELELYQDLTGKNVSVADVVAGDPELEKQLRQASNKTLSGQSLTDLVKNNKDASLDDTLKVYWGNFSQLDDALSKTAKGGLDIPDSQTLRKALTAAGVDPQKINNLSDQTIKSLMTTQDVDKRDLNNNQNQGNPLKDQLKEELKEKIREKVIKKGTQFAVKQGAKFAARIGLNIAGRAAGMVAAEVAAEAAGEAAGLAIAGSIEAATGPVGWAVGAVMAVGTGLFELGKFISHKIHERNEHRRERRDFDHTVSPTLDQFGIVKPG